jgi:hypothetical protein
MVELKSSSDSTGKDIVGELKIVVEMKILEDSGQ